MNFEEFNLYKSFQIGEIITGTIDYLEKYPQDFKHDINLYNQRQQDVLAFINNEEAINQLLTIVKDENDARKQIKDSFMRFFNMFYTGDHPYISVRTIDGVDTLVIDTALDIDATEALAIARERLDEIQFFTRQKLFEEKKLEKKFNLLFNYEARASRARLLTILSRMINDKYLELNKVANEFYQGKTDVNPTNSRDHENDPTFKFVSNECGKMHNLSLYILDTAREYDDDFDLRNLRYRRILEVFTGVNKKPDSITLGMDDQGRKIIADQPQLLLSAFYALFQPIGREAYAKVEELKPAIKSEISEFASAIAQQKNLATFPMGELVEFLLRKE